MKKITLLLCILVLANVPGLFAQEVLIEQECEGIHMYNGQHPTIACQRFQEIAKELGLDECVIVEWKKLDPPTHMGGIPDIRGKVVIVDGLYAVGLQNQVDAPSEMLPLRDGCQGCHAKCK